MSPRSKNACKEDIGNERVLLDAPRCRLVMVGRRKATAAEVMAGTAAEGTAAVMDVEDTAAGGMEEGID